MPALVEYLEMANGDPRKVQTLTLQWSQAVNHRRIDCADCTRPRGIEIAYRCLYCGVWFCAPCAEIHFGATVKDYHRIAARMRCSSPKIDRPRQ
jgi:hypothetical protein